jgi:hypothetical protein
MWWHTATHGRGSEGETGEWSRVTSTLRTTSEHVYPALLPLMAHTSAASSRLNWRPHRFKWTRTFRRKKKYGFCACAVTVQKQSTVQHSSVLWEHSAVWGNEEIFTLIMMKYVHRLLCGFCRHWFSLGQIYLMYFKLFEIPLQFVT